MRTPLSTLTLAGAAALAALAFTANPAAAKHGADDPAGHVRHARGADDGAKARGSRGKDDSASRRRHGADDAAGHKRHGDDDGPNHG